jgi:hypothetical protein
MRRALVAAVIPLVFVVASTLGVARGGVGGHVEGCLLLARRRRLA